MAKPINSSKTLVELSESARRYVPRKYYERTDIQILVDGIKAKQNCLLLGPRGVGKTTLAEVVAHTLQQRLVTVPCHTGASAESLIGQWVPNPAGTDGGGAAFIWMDGLITTAVRHGHILFLDEVNTLKPEVAMCIHGLLDFRRTLILQDKPGPDGAPEVIEAHPDFGFIAAGNPHYEGVKIMNEAFRDRFAVQLKSGYVDALDIEVLTRTQWAAKMTADMVTGMNAFITKIRKAAKDSQLYSDISTRAFIDLQQNIVLHGYTVARTMFLVRFDDDQEVSAIRTAFKDVWDDRGQLQPAIKSGGKGDGKTGRAGKFAAGAGEETKADAAATTP